MDQVQIDRLCALSQGEDSPKKLAGPWHVRRSTEHGDVWLRAKIENGRAATENGEEMYVAAVIHAADITKFWWSAWDDPGPKLGSGFVESCEDAKMQADVHLLAAGWTLLTGTP